MNITEIAKIAGVSVSAVSRYLNNGYISEEKSKKIAKAIHDTGYVPLKSAQNLRTGKTKLIGVIVPKISSESVARMVSGISEILESYDYRMILATTYNMPEKEIEYLNIFRDTTVDGVILMGTIMTKLHSEIITAYKKPIVLLAQNLSRVSCVYFDDYKAAYDATKCLIDRGSKKIAYIGVTQKDGAAGKSRADGFSDALKDAGIEFEKRLSVESDFSAEGAIEAIKRLLERNVKFDAVFCATDVIAAMTIRVLIKNGLKVPEDVIVSCVGDSNLTRYSNPTITSTHLFYKTGGEEAARMIMDLLESDEIISLKKNMIECKLMERESTGIFHDNDNLRINRN